MPRASTPRPRTAAVSPRNRVMEALPQQAPKSLAEKILLWAMIRVIMETTTPWRADRAPAGGTRESGSAGRCGTCLAVRPHRPTTHAALWELLRLRFLWDR